MCVLHVIHRVLVVFGARQIDIKHILGVGFAAEQKETHRVLAGPLNQIAQSDITTGALGNLDFLATAHDAHHGVQQIVGVALRNLQVLLHRGSLQTGAHPGDGAVVVCALDVDDFGETALPFGQVVRHIRHEIGIAAV